MKSNTWRFLLSRHDEPDTDPTDPPTDPPADPPATGEKDWKAEAEKWKSLSRKNEDQAKANAEAAKKLAEYETAQQTDAEKLTAKAEAAEKLAATATARAVSAEVRALAAAEFADPTDAALVGDLAKYAKPDGDVDVEAIKTDLAALLTAKPHLKKATGTGRPAPDQSQGRGNNNATVDFRTADKAAADAEFAKYGLRPRTYT